MVNESSQDVPATPAAVAQPVAVSAPPPAAVAPTPLEAIGETVSKARAAQVEWARRPLAERAKILCSVRDRLLDRAEAVARTVHEEVGKPEIEALLGEVLPTADVVNYWTRTIEELLDAVEVQLDKTTYPGKTAFLYREPRGVIGLITPWNYPVALPLRTMVPALLAGNTVVLKPSEVCPRTGALFADLFAGLVPEGVVEVVQGDGAAGARLAASDVDLVVFTGSVASGRKVAHACAERVSPCALELGGKDAAIVLSDANLERAANGVVWGAFTNAGQNCASIERVYVEDSIAQAFMDKVVARVRELKVPEEVAPVATEAQKATVARHVTAAVERGAKLLFGDEKGAGPTVLEVTDDESPLMQEETFGPVIPISRVLHADDAVARANASRFGLTASVWTTNVRRGEEIATRLRAGVVTINNHAFTGALPAAPWSGVGDTGYGITNSPLALEALTRPRFVLTDRSRGKSELWWYPYTPTLRVIALAMAVLRSGTSGIVAKVRAAFRLVVALPQRLLGR